LLKKFLYILIYFIYSLTIIPGLYSQWYNIYTSPYNDQSFANSIAINSNQNVFASGYLWTTPETNEDDYIIIKYGLNGDTVFTRTFNILGEDEAVTMAVDINNNIIVAGKSENPTVYDIVVLKYSSDGNLLWQASYNGPSNRRDEPCCSAVDDASNIYVLGKIYISNTQFNTVILKYNSSGTMQWANIINIGPGGITNPVSMALVKTTGNIYITGYYSDGVNNEIFTLKVTNNGAQQWIKMLSPQSVISSSSTSIALDNQENVFVCGKANINNSPGFITLKYNSSGDSIWSKVYSTSPSNSEDCAMSICTDSAGNSYITGKSYLGSGSVQNEIVTISYSPTGIQRWISHYYNNIDNIPVQIALNRNNKPIICAYSKGTPGYYEYLCLRYSSSGQSEGEQRFHAQSSLDNVPSAMCIDNNSDIYFTGYANFSYPKALTVKFANNVFGIQQIGTNIPEKYFLYQNYPNPFNPVTKITFALPPSPQGEGLGVRVIVYDILGKEVITLVSEQLNAGTYSVDWNASEYSSGVYFYKLQTDNFSVTKKMLMIK